MNTKVKTAIVGLVFGRYIVEDQILHGPGGEFLEISGVCDLDHARRDAIAGRNGLRRFESLEEILRDPEVEAVGLFTGPVGRAGLIRRIIRAGKHVMTTKPFELDADAALSVLQEARSLGKVVHLNSPGPLVEPEGLQILEWVKEFDLGRPISFHWETHGNSFEKADGSWYDDPEKCPAAPIFRLGIYAINQFTRLHGNIESVGIVSSRIRTGRPTDDNAILTLRFENGVIGSIHASFCVGNGYPYADDLIINYERGTIRSEAVATDQYGMTRKRVWLQTVSDAGEVFTRETHFGRDEKAGGYNWSAFYEAVRTGAPLKGEIQPEQIVAGIEVIAAMAEAEATGLGVCISSRNAVLHVQRSVDRQSENEPMLSVMGQPT